MLSEYLGEIAFAMAIVVPKSNTLLQVQTFYRFVPIAKDQIAGIKIRLESLALENNILGLIILSGEGLNATVTGQAEKLAAFVDLAARLLPVAKNFQNIKQSWIEESQRIPFLEFTVKIRPEIVSLKRPDLLPHPENSKTHLPPKLWHQLAQSSEALILDTRNQYESKIGTFKNAVTPTIDEFHEFPDWLKNSEELKNRDPKKPILIFCTGGIRCEKAVRSMEEQGFSEVYQLDGGILNYLEEFKKTEHPESLWQGECFVFDHRVAVDANGQATQKFSGCPHCGEAAGTTINCVRCDFQAPICEECLQKQTGAGALTCSKNCAHHWKLRPGKKGRKQGQPLRATPFNQ